MLGLTVSDYGNTAYVRFRGLHSGLLHIHRLLSICNNGFLAAERRRLMIVCVSVWEDLKETVISALEPGSWDVTAKVCFPVSECCCICMAPRGAICRINRLTWCHLSVCCRVKAANLGFEFRKTQDVCLRLEVWSYRSCTNTTHCGVLKARGFDKLMYPLQENRVTRFLASVQQSICMFCLFYSDIAFTQQSSILFIKSVNSNHQAGVPRVSTTFPVAPNKNIRGPV